MTNIDSDKHIFTWLKQFSHVNLTNSYMTETDTDITEWDSYTTETV